MKKIKYLFIMFVLLLIAGVYSCQQENVAPDLVQGTDVTVTSGDPTGDPDADDDDGDDGDDDD
jgi:hypothetical protein